MRRVVVLLLITVWVFLSGPFINDVNAKSSGQKPICSSKSANTFRCHAHIVTDSKDNPQNGMLPEGYGPSQFLGAYGLPSESSNNAVVAVVDAYDDPHALRDINTYSRTFGIPKMKNCAVSTKGSGCFEKISQRGTHSYPRTDAGWVLEESLDIEAVHAICQSCNILLVESDSESFANLLTAFDKAASFHPKVISNSYGSKEFSGEKNFDFHFNRPGIAVTFSSGDSGYGVEYPAASKYVTSVGGTSLKLSGNNYISESAWRGAGSGCSKYEEKPGWQFLKGCKGRSVADVSADADPRTGAAVFDSTPFQGKSGWFKVGGTSLASPVIAAVYALSAHRNDQIPFSSLPYSLGNRSNLHDIRSGKNGKCKIPSLCKSGKGYDGPTGLGSPIGLSAF